MEKGIKKYYKDGKEQEKEELYQQILAGLAKDGKLCFRNDLLIIFPYCRTTLDNWYPKNSAKGIEIDRRLLVNRRLNMMRFADILVESGSPQGLMFLYRIMAEDEERARLKEGQQPQANVSSSCDGDNASNSIDIDSYMNSVRTMLKELDRYSPALEAEISAMSSAWATLNAANREIKKLSSPFLEEVTTQGKKIVEHPAFALQRRAMDAMSTHSKLLGIDFENVPAMATEGPLAELTRDMIAAMKPEGGHITPAPEKKKKSRTKKGKNEGKKDVQ